MAELTLGSLFAGIGGFDLGLERAGMGVLWQAESDPHCRRALGKHWPATPCYRDVRDVCAASTARPDVICGGFPCQDLSVAGRRKGLKGECSGLFFEFVRIVRELQPALVLVENVPGLLSSNGGRDFGIVLRELVQCGARDVCWRVLDSQYFGLAQRRKRVFVVADFGGERAGEILLEPRCGCRNPPPRRETGAGAAAGITERTRSDDNGSNQLVTHTLTADGAGVREDGTGRGTPLAPCGAAVRRLMPVECLRLQGFPDDWLDLEPPLSDSAKYRMNGNAVSVPVAEWIGRRIVEVTRG